MKELSRVINILRKTTPRVLATLGKVEGSSYRRSGARLVWSPEAPRVGSISGGCLEDDLIERAKGVLAGGVSETVIYDTTGENDLVWGVGLGCHGIATILLERITGFPPPWELLENAWRSRQAVAFVTVIRAEFPRLLGTQLALTSEGSRWAADTTAARWEAEATACLKDQRSRTLERESPSGRLELFCEYLPPPVALHIFGAGDDARPLVRLTKELGWRTAVYDARAGYATRERFPEADEVRVISPEKLDAMVWDPQSVAVVMTHHYRFDLPLLRQLLPLRLPYLGLLGPKKRATGLLADLTSQSVAFDETILGSLRAPVGLDLGGGSPEEVAFSIVAEIQAVLNDRDGQPLRKRSRPIHE